MVNYSNGKIYKIEPLNADVGDCYIGSTTKELLSQRMSAHRNEFRCSQKGLRRKTMSHYLFSKYGVDICNISLIESCPCNSKDELLARESYHQNAMKNINKCILRSRLLSQENI